MIVKGKQFPFPKATLPKPNIQNRLGHNTARHFKINLHGSKILYLSKQQNQSNSNTGELTATGDLNPLNDKIQQKNNNADDARPFDGNSDNVMMQEEDSNVG